MPVRIYAIFLTTLLMGIPSNLKAQVVFSGARIIALGHAGKARTGTSWTQYNTAAPATCTERAFSFSGSEAFGVSDLRIAAFSYAEPIPWGTISVMAQTFGFETYRENLFRLGYARVFTLGDYQIALGGSTQYATVSIPGYGSAGALGLSVGGLIHLGSTIQMGFQTTNLNRPHWAGSEALHRTVALGLAYRPIPTALLLLDVVKDLQHPATLRAGLEVHPVQPLTLRTGMTAQPARFSVGLGVQRARVRADLAGERHPILGWTPALSLNLFW
jgi:hypothetical protein